MFFQRILRQIFSGCFLESSETRSKHSCCVVGLIGFPFLFVTRAAFCTPRPALDRVTCTETRRGRALRGDIAVIVVRSVGSVPNTAATAASATALRETRC